MIFVTFSFFIYLFCIDIYFFFLYPKDNQIFLIYFQFNTMPRKDHILCFI